MGLKEILANGLLLRRLTHAVERMENHLNRLATAVEQMAAVVAPKVVETSSEELRSTGVSYSRDLEQGRALQFEEEIFRKLGRAPTEAEILDFLDGKPSGLVQ